MTESAPNLARDYFKAPYWYGAKYAQEDPFWRRLPDAQDNTPMMEGVIWDAHADAPKEIAVDRHNGGFNSIYADGHVRWARWKQLWYRDLSDPDPAKRVYEGAFDPRQN